MKNQWAGCHVREGEEEVRKELMCKTKGNVSGQEVE